MSQPPSTKTPRSGLLAGGNFIIDHIKMIDAYPAENMLANISGESSANGGGPYNVLKNLAKLGATFPLEAVGLIGDDEDGRKILADCDAHHIDTSQIHQTELAHTSYTDAMTVTETGRRTFFHQPGANALLDVSHFNFSRSNARLFHLAYLMLLRTLDTLDSDNATAAAHLLANAQQLGFITTCDIVSTNAPDLLPVARAALPYIDHLIINEIEAGAIIDHDLRPAGSISLDAAKTAAQSLLHLGVSTRVVIHFEEGAVAANSKGDIVTQPSLNLPPDFIQGATGAGDAFATGYLYGVHEDLPLNECLRYAVCVAAQCLTDPTTSNGIQPLPTCLALSESHGFRSLP
ncbi:MAG: carbohydrate kinase family protein [Verrucomicrobiota bacterium]